MKLPHSLRLIIFFLRLALGLDFFYLGWSTLFNAPLGREFSERSLTDLYAWLGAATGGASEQQIFAWAFLVIGICLVAGLATRFAAIAGIGLTLVSFLPGMSYITLSLTQFISDEILVVICLLILIFANSGTYLGIDMFFHWHFARQHKKQ